MDEGGTHAYTVKLGTEPTADVTVAIARAAGGDSDITVAPASLTFNANNYSTAQTVTISAAEDNSDYADDTATITHSVTTTDSIYTEQTIGDIAVTAEDNDATLILSADTVTVREYNNATYTVKLTHQPTDDVVVTIAEGTGTNDDTSIRVSSPSNKTLTFDSTNWNTPQTVRLYANGDSDSVNGTRSYHAHHIGRRGFRGRERVADGGGARLERRDYRQERRRHLEPQQHQCYRAGQRDLQGETRRRNPRPM